METVYLVVANAVPRLKDHDEVEAVADDVKFLDLNLVEDPFRDLVLELDQVVDLVQDLRVEDDDRYLLVAKKNVIGLGVHLLVVKKQGEEKALVAPKKCVDAGNRLMENEEAGAGV